MTTRDTQTIERQLNAQQKRLLDAEANVDAADHAKSCAAHQGLVELLRAMAGAQSLLIDDKLAGIGARADGKGDRRANIALVVAALLMVSELAERAFDMFRHDPPPRTIITQKAAP